MACVFIAARLVDDIFILTKIKPRGLNAAEYTHLLTRVVKAWPSEVGPKANDCFSYSSI